MAYLIKPRSLIRFAALGLLGAGVLGMPERSEARLDPFYILRNQNFAQFKPRVLFAVDTSGSMTWLPKLPVVGCLWNECEGANSAKESRIAGARRAMRDVIAQAGEQASFSLMTFGHVKPPTSSGTVPLKCYHQPTNKYYRFIWTTWTTSQTAGWQSTINPFGTQGNWQLCGDKKAYAYMRHDGLGGFAMPDDQGGVPPAAPLYKSVATAANYYSGLNYSRNVQWFPEFKGVRTNLDCANATQKTLLNKTFGDYGNTNAAREAAMCGRDFYYVPYVDGFQGYPQYTTYAATVMSRTYKDPYGNTSSGYSNYHNPGVMRRDYAFDASLFAPFFSQAAIDSVAVPAGSKGPASEDEVRVTLDGLTAPQIEGGIDAHYGTPHYTFTGDVDTFVTVAGQNITPKAALPITNAPFSHASIASYLSFMKTVSEEDLCVPTVAVILTDGEPSPGEGGTPLYTRLEKLRNKLGVKTYLVAFSEGFDQNPAAWAQIQHMACAAAGSDNTAAPCAGNNAYDWDTCADPNNHANGCAYKATDPATLATALTKIIAGAIDTPIPAGPPSSANEFIPDPNDPKKTIPVQTDVVAWTETPGFKGHVSRAGCDTLDENNQLESFCSAASDPPETLEDSAVDEGDTGCGLARSWDAGTCLANKTWNERRIYSYDDEKKLYRVSDVDGTASAKFTAELDAQGLLTPGNEQAEADAIAVFLLGKDLPDGWKLPALPNASPVLVRRIPRRAPAFAPSVNIRDPHCAGRRIPASNPQDVPKSLIDFADSAWNLVGGKYEYAEAVVVGDDFGVLHGFHLDSGNELFGLLPRPMLSHIAKLAANGTGNFGQPTDLTQHSYGLASTANVGWIFDETANNGTGAWRHLAVFGFGPGGKEIVALDVSHMGRVDTDPVEVLWSTDSVSNAMKADYDATLGDTWSRPALTYAVEADNYSAHEPKAYVVFASGYGQPDNSALRGRSMWMVDAVTGETVTDGAFMPPPDAGDVYGKDEDYALPGDVAVGTHCISRYWGEMQEAYYADPAGRLFRWDLAAQTNNVTAFDHVADSGDKWFDNGNEAIALTTFPACASTAELSCTVQNSNKGDVFTFSPAVVASNRIDPENDDGQAPTPNERDNFLIALNSGSLNDDAIDGTNVDNDFHSSLYLFSDDHRVTKNGGLDIPGGAPETDPGDHPHFMRLPLSSLERKREWTYADGTEASETRVFSKRSRPLRAPRIIVTGVADPNNNNSVIENLEAMYVTYTVHEPSPQNCDPKWYDEDTKTWVFDQGSTYEITFRLISENGEFQFDNNNTLPFDPGDGFGAGYGMGPGNVEQIRDGACADGVCGPQLGADALKPCDPNTNPPVGAPPRTVQTGWAELEGFSPLEVPLP